MTKKDEILKEIDKTMYTKLNLDGDISTVIEAVVDSIPDLKAKRDKLEFYRPIIDKDYRNFDVDNNKLLLNQIIKDGRKANLECADKDALDYIIEAEDKFHKDLVKLKDSVLKVSILGMETHPIMLQKYENVLYPIIVNLLKLLKIQGVKKYKDNECKRYEDDNNSIDTVFVDINYTSLFKEILHCIYNKKSIQIDIDEYIVSRRDDEDIEIIRDDSCHKGYKRK